MKKVFVAAAAAALGIVIYLPVAFAGDTASSTVASQVASTPRYEWQYHYVGHHPRYEGYWALVR
jgi:hypothetical protein